MAKLHVQQMETGKFSELSFGGIVIKRDETSMTIDFENLGFVKYNIQRLAKDNQLAIKSTRALLFEQFDTIEQAMAASTEMNAAVERRSNILKRPAAAEERPAAAAAKRVKASGGANRLSSPLPQPLKGKGKGTGDSHNKKQPSDSIPWTPSRGKFFTKAKSSLAATLPLMYYLAGGRNDWADDEIFDDFTVLLEDRPFTSLFIKARVATKTATDVTNADIYVRDKRELTALRAAAARAGAVIDGEPAGVVIEGEPAHEDALSRIVFQSVEGRPKTFAMLFIK